MPEQPRMSGQGAGPLLVDAVAFLCELAMLALLAVAGWGLAHSGVLRAASATLLPVLAAALWSVWMAPRSARRLADPGRLVAQLALFAATAALAAAAGHWAWGVGFAAVATAAFGLARRTGGVTGSTVS